MGEAAARDVAELKIAQQEGLWLGVAQSVHLVCAELVVGTALRPLGVPKAQIEAQQEPINASRVEAVGIQDHSP
jgi:hypothetical protein